MRLLTATVPSNCDIVLQGDGQEGNAATSHSAIDATLDWILARQDRRFVHMGDAVDAIMTDDKRYHDGTETDPIPLRQIAAVVRQYGRASKRCLVWLTGNHEERLHRFGDLGAEMAQRLGVEYGTWTCKLQLQDAHGPFAKFYLTHGFRGTLTSNAKDYEQRRANIMAALKMRLAYKAADCIVMAMGHTHKLMVVEPAHRLILTDDGQRLVQHYLGPGDGREQIIEPDRRWYCNTGSFLRTFELGVNTYSEMAGYDPVELGYVVVEVRDRRVVACRAVNLE